MRLSSRCSYAVICQSLKQAGCPVDGVLLGVPYIKYSCQIALTLRYGGQMEYLEWLKEMENSEFPSPNPTGRPSEDF